MIKLESAVDVGWNLNGAVGDRLGYSGGHSTFYIEWRSFILIKDPWHLRCKMGSLINFTIVFTTATNQA